MKMAREQVIAAQWLVRARWRAPSSKAAVHHSRSSISGVSIGQRHETLRSPYRRSQLRTTAARYENARLRSQTALPSPGQCWIATSNECNFSFKLVHVFLSSHQSLSG